MYVDEEAERATRWDAFLAQKRDDNGNDDDDDARDGARTLDALVRVLDARAARGSGDDASEESDEEQEKVVQKAKVKALAKVPKTAKKIQK